MDSRTDSNDSVGRLQTTAAGWAAVNGSAVLTLLTARGGRPCPPASRAAAHPSHETA